MIEVEPVTDRPPVVLCILDGWGCRDAQDGNAIALARTPHWDRLQAACPHSRLDASATEVGLPEGQMGNSEVGHMNIGAGRVVMQDLPLISAALADGGLTALAPFQAFVARLQASGGVCHLMGLMSPGGVHSHQDHIAALACALDEAGIPVRVHAFLDGRDTPPKSAVDYVKQFNSVITDCDDAAIATIGGRYYAMDRDKRWDRVARAYRCLVDADSPREDEAIAAIRASYRADVGDEFVPPTVIGDYTGMADGDGLIMANFRADRAREILEALVDPSFDGFPRARQVTFAASLGMTEYSDDLNRRLAALFPSEDIDDTLGAVVAAAGLKQLRTAETEKYAHVTFFLNGGREHPYDGEDRHLVPSPDVATYDLAPAMAATGVADAVIAAVKAGDTALIVVNFANTDMVGHTGKLDAAIRAVEAVDDCLGRIGEAVQARGGAFIVTADHGNAEQMFSADGESPHTAHTTNPVPFLIAGRGQFGLANGRLADIAPTVLALLGLEKPAAMTGRNLIISDSASQADNARARAPA